MNLVEVGETRIVEFHAVDERVQELTQIGEVGEKERCQVVILGRGEVGSAATDQSQVAVNGAKIADARLVR